MASSILKTVTHEIGKNLPSDQDYLLILSSFVGLLFNKKKAEVVLALFGPPQAPNRSLVPGHIYF